MTRDIVAKDIWTSATEEITTLHSRNIDRAREMSVDGIRIGEILTQVRGALLRGEWSDWVEFNLPFCIRQAQRYMNYYENRDQIKNDIKSLTAQQPLLITPTNGANRSPQQLHESDFWIRNVKLGQTWWGTINHEIQDHPIETWRKDQIQSMAATLEPYAELYQRLRSLIE